MVDCHNSHHYCRRSVVVELLAVVKFHDTVIYTVDTNFGISCGG